MENDAISEKGVLVSGALFGLCVGGSLAADHSTGFEILSFC